MHPINCDTYFNCHVLMSSCPLVALITCLKSHRSLRVNYGNVFQQCQVGREAGSQWQGHLLSCQGKADKVKLYSDQKPWNRVFFARGLFSLGFQWPKTWKSSWGRRLWVLLCYHQQMCLLKSWNYNLGRYICPPTFELNIFLQTKAMLSWKTFMQQFWLVPLTGPHKTRC